MGAQKHGQGFARRAPGPLLAPYVRELWTSERASGVQGDRELTLPTGGCHVVFRVQGGPIRLFTLEGEVSLGHAAVSGVRSRPYLRDTPAPALVVGAQLAPHAAFPLFAVSGEELAERHTPLEALWGRHALDTLERLAHAATPAARLDVLEAALLARLARPRAIHPAVLSGLPHLAHGGRVAEVVAESGHSHRRFVALFREQVGLSPKHYARVARFGRALARVHAREPLAQVAAAAGYADQAHFARDFREHALCTPSEYLRRVGRAPVHLDNFLQDPRSVAGHVPGVGSPRT